MSTDFGSMNALDGNGAIEEWYNEAARTLLLFPIVGGDGEAEGGLESVLGAELIATFGCWGLLYEGEVYKGRSFRSIVPQKQ